VTAAGAPPTSGARASILAGLAAAFVAAVEMIRWVRLDLLLDAEIAWAPMRLLLGLAALAVAGSAGVLAAAFCWFATSALESRQPVALPFGRSGLIALGAVAILAGAALRIAGLGSIPVPLWIDDLSEIAPALALRGAASDFATWSYPVPYVPGEAGGSVGTIYLELYRASLELFGTTVIGVRAPSAMAGVLSLVTATLLGRALLPRGGGALTGLVLAGLRWHLILSRWAWNAIVLVPLLDIAALLLLSARRRSRPLLAALSGAVAGLGAHVYLAAWSGAAALGLWALWPRAEAEPAGRRLPRAALFAAGFALAVLPLVAAQGDNPYFARVGANTPLDDSRRAGSHWYWPPIENVAAALGAPFWTPDPVSRHDIPGRARLGWIVGAAVAAALLRALQFPRDELSGWLLANGAVAFATSMAWGRPGTPNGYRYAYLTTAAAVAAAGGALWLLSAVPGSRRRQAGLAIVGAFALSGVLGARDALIVWPERRSTFEGFWGGDTLIGRAAARWEPYGVVRVEKGLGYADRTIDTVRRYRLDPSPRPSPGGARRRMIRVAAPSARAGPEERIVERVRDAWGRDLAVVVAGRASNP
jgi:hypothetical protein